MTEPENFEDDLFADLYDDNEPAKPAQSQPVAAPPAAAPASYETSYSEPAQTTEYDGGGGGDSHVNNNEEYEEDDDDVDFNLGNGMTTQHADTPTYSTPTPVAAAVRGPNAKEDG